MVGGQHFDHSGVGAGTAAEFIHPVDPAVGPLQGGVGPLGFGPFPLAQGHVADKGSHLPGDLATGLAQQEAVGGEGAQLGMGGHPADVTVVAHQPVGAEVFPDLRHGQLVGGIAQGVAHSQTQQTAPVCRFQIVHRMSSLEKLRFDAEFTSNNVGADIIRPVKIGMILTIQIRN